MQSKKKIITSAHVQSSAYNRVKTKKVICAILRPRSGEEQKKGHYVHRCPILRTKSDKVQKNGHHVNAITSVDARFSTQNRVKCKKKVITSAGKVCQTTSVSLKCASGSFSDPLVSSSPSLPYSVHLVSCRLGFDSESGQTNDGKIAIHSFPA